VPTYKYDVPFELARTSESIGAGHVLRASPDSFGPILKRIAKEHHASYIDVYEAMCRPECATDKGGHSLYRDDHHLSVFGALAYSSLVEDSVLYEDESWSIDRR
jgi:hypothetical protein